MASTITHAYFIMDVYEKLNTNIKEFLIDQKELLKTSAQSMDTLFFYNITKFNKGKRIRDFGDYFHDHDTYLFFETLINYIKYNGYGQKPDVMAYLYGMLSHYVLDSNLHPFIVYKTGDKNMLHPEVESYFDNYLIKLKEQAVPWKFKCHNFCFNTKKLSPTLKEVINFTYKETFDINNMSKFYLKAIKDMKSFYKIFRYDPTGIKYKFYNLVDFICPKSFRRKSPLSYHLKMNESYYNLDHKTWYNPTTKKIKSNKSILDIYVTSLHECVNLINNINEYIYNDKGNLKDILKNVSYLTGRETEKHYELKYFE